MTTAGFFWRKPWFIFPALILVVLVPAWQPAASERQPVYSPVLYWIKVGIEPRHQVVRFNHTENDL